MCIQIIQGALFLGLLKIEPIALRRGLDAVAITDHNTIDGAMEVLRQAKKIKVIIGKR